jgi:tripartite-type tricarboxylate transporter receptor subunit TctC
MSAAKGPWGLIHDALRAAAMPALVALALSPFCLDAASAETDYPSKLIKIIVPFPAGGPPDAIARVLALHLHNRIGQTIVIENRPGAGTTIGTRSAATANPDGYTLLFTGNNLCYFPVLYPKLDFDPDKSLATVATVVAYSHVMVVASGVPAKSVAELAAYAKVNPGRLMFGYAPGTPPHILGEAFRQATAALSLLSHTEAVIRQEPTCWVVGFTSTWRRWRRFFLLSGRARSGRWLTLVRSEVRTCRTYLR